MLRTGSVSPAFATPPPRIAHTAVEEPRHLPDTSHVGPRDGKAFRQPRHGIRADVGLDAEVPLVALPDVMHLGVLLPGVILRRRQRVDDRRIPVRALPQPRAPCREMPDDVPEQRLA